MSEYKVGDRVNRIEDRDITAATVIQVLKISLPDDKDEYSLELAYDEGGSGWWPSSTVKHIE